MVQVPVPIDAGDDGTVLDSEPGHEVTAATKSPGHPTILLPDGPLLEDLEAE